MEASLQRLGDDHDRIRDRDALSSSQEAEAGGEVVDRFTWTGKWFEFRGDSSELIEQIRNSVFLRRRSSRLNIERVEMRRYKVGVASRVGESFSNLKVREIEVDESEDSYPKLVEALRSLLITEGIYFWWNELKTVTVCDKCFRAACFQGEIHCNHATEAGTTVKTVDELRAMNLESPDYWRIDIDET